MDKVYNRTENGTLTTVSKRDGMDEINNAMIGPTRSSVRTMSSINRTDYAIEYKDGRKVRLVLADAPAPVAEQPKAEEQTWSSASLSNTLLHRFTAETDPKDRRALCNKRFRAVRHGDGYSFRTRAERDASEYGDLYTYCTRCEGK